MLVPCAGQARVRVSHFGRAEMSHAFARIAPAIPDETSTSCAPAT